MDPQSRRPDPSVRETLAEESHQFRFVQAVRLLKLLSPSRQGVGGIAKPKEEIVRFRTRQTLSFPPSEIYELKLAALPDRPPEMTIAFMGLTGASGVLPRHYTELLLERIRQKDFALVEFLDLFNHRMVSLFYRAWEKHHCAVEYEKALVEGKEDRVSEYLFALMGLSTTGVREHLHLNPRHLLRYVGLVGQRPRSAEALQRGLADYLGVPVRIRQFMGIWLELAERDWTKLGILQGNNRLGQSAVAGTRVWDQQGKFRIELGSMDLRTFQTLLPGGTEYPALVEFAKFFSGPELEFDIQLKLQGNEVPFCRLRETTDYAPRLGWTTWLKTGEFTHDATDVVCPSEALMETSTLA